VWRALARGRRRHFDLGGRRGVRASTGTRSDGDRGEAHRPRVEEHGERRGAGEERHDHEGRSTSDQSEPPDHLPVAPIVVRPLPDSPLLGLDPEIPETY
jgi:hypothetical protein